MKQLLIYSCLGLGGATAYPLIEIMVRGRSHWSMALAGGVGLLLLFALAGRMPNRPLLLRCLVGSGLITGLEFAVGLIVNLLLDLRVWDYHQQPGNLLGQICPLFSFFWFLLCLPIMPFLGRLYRRFKLGGPASPAQCPTYGCGNKAVHPYQPSEN